MRRNSVVAPLLLIGIGLLFLAHNVYPNLALATYVGRYWPWILIAWGGLRSVEILWWRSQGRALPSYGLSGGEWAIAVFVCLLGAGLHTADGFAANWPNRFRINGVDMLGEPYDFPVALERPCGKAPHILLDKFRGDIKLTGVDAGAAGDRVKLSGTKSIRSMDPKEAQRFSENATIEVTGDANDLVLRADSSRATYKLEINVPRGSRVEIHGEGGELNVEDLAGVVLISARGDVRAKNISGPTQITIRRGDVHLEAARVAGQIEVSSGDIEATQVTGPLRISARSGDVKVGPVSGTVDIDVQRGDVEVRAGVPLGAIDVKARTGDITLALPADAPFNMDGSTNNGAISSEFSQLKSESRGRTGNIRGSVGSGSTGPSLQLHTQRGDVAIRKATAVVGSSAGNTSVLEKIEQ